MATAMGAIPGSLTVSHARRRRNQFQAYSKGYIQRAAFFGDLFQPFGKRLFRSSCARLGDRAATEIPSTMRMLHPLQHFQALVATAGFYLDPRRGSIQTPALKVLPRSRIRSTLRLPSCMLFERDNPCSNGSNRCFSGSGLFC